MAKQEGHLPLKGTVGGINYYTQNGVKVARAAGGGFTTNAIKMSPRMEAVRQNGSEFGNRARAQKVFKDSMRLFFGTMKDRGLHTRMTQLFIQLKDCDSSSARGQRRVGIGLQTSEGKRLLKQFEFNPNPLRIKNADYDAITFSYTSGAIHTTDFNYRNGATHLEVCLGVIVMDFEKLESKLFASEPVYISKTTPFNNFTLTPTDTPTGAGMRITVLWHQYLKEINGEFYPLQEQGLYGIRVLDC